MFLEASLELLARAYTPWVFLIHFGGFFAPFNFGSISYYFYVSKRLAIVRINSITYSNQTFSVELKCIYNFKVNGVKLK